MGAPVRPAVRTVDALMDQRLPGPADEAASSHPHGRAPRVRLPRAGTARAPARGDGPAIALDTRPALDKALAKAGRQRARDTVATMLSLSLAHGLRLLDAVLATTGDALLVTDAGPQHPAGPRILYVNAAFTRLTGYASEDVLGQTPRLLQGPDTDRGSLERIAEALARSEPIELELLNYRRDGSVFWVELTLAPVRDGRDRVTHWLSLQRDVTARKLAEAAAYAASLAEARNRALAAELEERKQVEAQLLHAAFHDDLTRLRNRAFFMDRLRCALEQARTRPPFGFAVLFIDLDRFKAVNDTLGHTIGDELLVVVAQRLAGCIRPQDVLARLGGDEFAILADDATQATAEVIARRVVESLRLPVHLETCNVDVSCSIGIVTAPGDYELPERLLRDADLAMYGAKKAGGRGHVVFSAARPAGAPRTPDLRTELQGAIQAGELRVHFQPIRHAASGSMTGFEALLRWHHPRRGLMLPAEFIPIAEEIGLIGEIGRWVRHEACAQMRDWAVSHPGRRLRVGVNVSGSELLDALFVERLQQLLAKFGVAPGSLELEITESVLLNHSQALAHTLQRIRDTGVRLALDDFGTGYSSLGYLNDYALDTIKIDRSFVASLPGRQRTMAIVETIVRLGHALGLEVVAEGVETAAQLEAVTALGCDYVQGVHVAAPMPAAQAGTLLGHASPSG